MVLSGTGSDGAHGLRTLKAAGGLAIVQEPATARFDAMPAAAIRVSGPDLVLAPGQIGRRLSDLARDEHGWAGEPLATDEAGSLAPLLSHVRRVSGIDFSGYKESTLRRQVQRRMAVRQIGGLADYLPILAADDAEAASLAQNLLVTVTSFFRDPRAFEALGRRLADYVAAHDGRGTVRVWVPGCASGEEVYTIAMLVSEALGAPADMARWLKIFGTDLDEGNLAAARAARYSALAAEAIPAHLRQRYLVEGSGGAEVVAGLRDCAVFARHNVLTDPPFPRLDLVSCRNTMMYFRPDLQERVLSTLGYALLPGGLLMLGASEALTPGLPGFEALDPEMRIFERTAEPLRLPAPMGGPYVPETRRVPAIRGAGEPPSPEPVILHEELLRAFARPSLVLDEAGTLVEAWGDVSGFCRVPEGPPAVRAEQYVRPELRAEARALLLLARGEGPVVRGRMITMMDGTTVVLEARRVAAGGRDYRVLSFVSEDAGTSATLPPGERDAQLDVEIERLQAELADSEETLQRSLAELESVNEELQASSEELQASSEELQASYEELQTANEELRATNDELASSNDQLRTSAHQLGEMNDDLEGILSSMGQGLVLVDTDLLVTRYSPLAVRLFALVDEDIGRSILTVPTTMAMPGLHEALLEVLAGGPVRVLEVSGPSGTFLVRVLRHEDSSGRLRGMIVSMTDVSELVALRQAAEAALAEFTRLADALSEAVWRRDADSGALLYASARIAEFTGWTPEDLLAEPGRLDDCIAAEDRARVLAARRGEATEWVVEYRIVARDGRERWVRETGSRAGGIGGPELVGTLADITERHEIEQRAADLTMAYDTAFHTSVMGVAMLDPEDRVLFANDAFSRMTGYDSHEVVGLRLTDLRHPDGSTGDDVALAAESGAGGPLLQTQHMVRPDGSEWWASVEMSRLPRLAGEMAAQVVVTDMSELRERTRLLAMQAQVDPLTGLLNRRAFDFMLEREVRRVERTGAPLAIVWIDLDRFKEANDAFGHEAGDEVLRQTAARLEAAVRVNDVVARLGGDEFGLILTGFTDVGDLDPPLDRLVTALRQPVVVGDVEVIIAASVGVAVHPDDGAGAEILVRAADTAMYTAKAEGGDRYRFFRPAMNTEADQRRSMRQAVSAALAARAFVLHYQPILDARDGAVWGVEALVRWPQDGRLLQARDFVPYCEASGQIRELGLLIASMLRAETGALRAAAPDPLVVTMNLSVLQLATREGRVRAAHEPVPWSDLGVVVEVKESVFLPEHARALAALEELSGEGTPVAIDDYGTGLTNFTLLQSVSPRYLKLGAVIPGDGDVGDDHVRAAVGLAHALGAKVVAEGVHDHAQREHLADLGVDLVQGQGLAVEMPLAELRTWLGSAIDPRGHG